MKIIPIIFSLLLTILISGCNSTQPSPLLSPTNTAITKLKQSEPELSDRPSIIKTTSPSVKNIIPTTMATITFASTPATDPSNDQLIIVARTIKNLSDRIKTPVDQIDLTSIEAVLWSDPSLGCLIHGSVVNDIEIPGYIIKLTANGQTFTFHTDTNIQSVMCSDEKPFEIYHPP